MDNESIKKFNITQQECDKLISLIELINQYSKKTRTGFDDFMSTKIPIGIFRDYGFTLLDVNKLSDILDIPSLKVNNHNGEIILRRNPFGAKSTQEQIQVLKDITHEEKVLQKEIIREVKEKTMIQIVYKNKKHKPNRILIKGDYLYLDGSSKSLAIKNKRMMYIKKLAESKEPLKKKDLDQKKVKNFSATIKRLSRHIRNSLGIQISQELIINPNRMGYKFNDEYYEVIKERLY